MSLLIDLLTGKLFSFKTAKGTDINTGTSDKLIVSPKSIMDSYLGNDPITTLNFGIDTLVSNGNATFTAGTQYEMTPDTGDNYFLTGRANAFSARLFIYAKVDSGVVGEACLFDVMANSAVTGSNFTYTNTTLALLKSNVFTIAANKVYTYAIRRVSGGLLTNAQIRAAFLTIKILKL